jgi:hypothetical protein
LGKDLLTRISPPYDDLDSYIRGPPTQLTRVKTRIEDFLVLSDECVAIVDGEERPVKQRGFAAEGAGFARRQLAAPFVLGTR